MDVQNSSPDQEIGNDQQPSELPVFGEKDDSLETTDHVPLNTETKTTLATEPFQPILKVLAEPERDDPKFAFPAARLLGLYRHLWESCVSKHIDGQKLRQENLDLEEAGAHLRKERDSLQVRHDKQLSRLRFFEQALESSRERLVNVLHDRNYPFRLNLADLE
ncbi:unnamed protein product [Penicillium salamii]|uniref:Uncharacterized protein n=1 Tax=Penicillium salamii TaxID=1612424 RepID=A0A9W4NBM4_9EURO|nr:unnamed protein product [Penicillium salamii]CAG7971551.1 unnamed protein product [Penicillium salamii]CAG7988336.1 unnamed protein product [Penicillium salamii]CAG7992454.1 unnamed protein product [Penicillium salamii]CAG7997527.1 unnamed protein product [Penicillium salamii]